MIARVWFLPRDDLPQWLWQQKYAINACSFILAFKKKKKKKRLQNELVNLLWFYFCSVRKVREFVKDITPNCKSQLQ